MAEIVTLPRAGTVEIIQEFAAAPAAPARPILAPVIIGSCFQVADDQFAGFYSAKFDVADELVGTGTGVQTQFFLDQLPVNTDTVVLHKGSISGTVLTPTTHYTVVPDGTISLTPAGVAFLGLDDLHAAYSYAPSQTYVYPNIKEGAEVENASEVEVLLRTVEDIFDITNGFGVTIGLTSVTVPGNVSPSRAVTQANGQMLINALVDTIEDTSVDFFALGVRAGDTLRLITNPALLERSDSIPAIDSAAHTILSIPNNNTVTITPPIASQGGKVEYEILRGGSGGGEILLSYRARRSDLVGQLLEFELTTDVETQIGPITPDNPLAYGVAKALGATDKMVFAMMVKDQDSATDHQEAMEILAGEDVYFLVPLTNNRAIHQLYLAHCDQESAPEGMHERRVMVPNKAIERRVYQNELSTGEMAVGSQTFTDPNASFITNGVPVGAVIRLSSPAQIEIGNVFRKELIISGIISQTQLSVIQSVTHGTDIVGEAVGTGTGAQLTFQLAATQNVVPTSVVMFLNGAQVGSSGFSVTTGGLVTFVVPPGLGVVVTANYEVTPIGGIQYTVESQELSNFEVAQDVAAVGAGYKNRRITVGQADIAIADDGTEVEPYFFNCAVAGLVSALAPNQPIANIPIPGFLGVKHVRKFSETHFGLMAAYGISVFIQDRPTSPVVMRNWITTDVTNVNTRECSIVNMVDYYSKFLRTNVKQIAGRFNITDAFIDDMLRPAINGVNREMMTAGFIGQSSQIVSIQQSTVNKDQLHVIEEIEFFAPANKITITVRVL